MDLLSCREELIPVELVQKGDKIKVMRVTMVKLHYFKQLGVQVLERCYTNNYTQCSNTL